MNISERDRCALVGLGIAAVVGLVVQFWPSGADPKTPGAVISTFAPGMLEPRLLKLRSLAAEQPGRSKILDQVKNELKTREKGILQADTAAQAQAQLVQIVRTIGRSVVPPVEARQADIGRVSAFGTDYGEVTVAVQFEAGITQIVSVLGAIGSQPELIATTELRILEATAKDKLMQVRLVVSGIVPKRLVPEKKNVSF